jgi:hypothetical protein
MNKPVAHLGGRRISRRQLLRYGGYGLAALPALSLLRALPRSTPPVSAAERQATPLRAGEWSLDDTVRAFGAADWVEFRAPHQFGAIGAHWSANAGEDIHLAISVSADGAAWSAWQTLHACSHGPVASQTAGRPDRRFAELALTETSELIRCRAVDHDGRAVPPPPDLRLVYIDPGDSPALAETDQALKAFSADEPKIVSRAEWGCEEKYRFDKAGKEIWEREYYTIEKVIIHHTDSPNGQDPRAALRAVYYYHAVTQEWGDIGYNYLIGRDGTVYEGRFGGPNVVAGHALQYNYGSVGIGLLGSFTNAPPPSSSPSPSAKPGTPTAKPSAPPTSTPTPRQTVAPYVTPAMETALINLVAHVGRYIDPQGKYFFIDKMIPNIVGHRDVLSTSCPGDNFYPRLAKVRTGAATILGAPPKMDLEIVGIKGGESVITKSPYTAIVTVKNTGTAVIPSYYDKGLTYAESENYDTKKRPAIQGKFRIVADIEGSDTAKTPGKEPYRWGFGKSLNPGETVDVPCKITFGATGERKLQFGIVQEKTTYWAQGLAGPSVRVIGNPVDPVAKPTTLNGELLYFAETGHTLRGNTLRYWNKFGGLAQFGYPLTEEFVETSESDGKEYTVQYFERARFELHPENAGTDYEVLLGLLGRLYHAVDKPATALKDQRYFPETGHNLGGVFRNYWEQYGGLFIYGVPLTEEFKEKSRIDGKEYTVQYFERARFEYHPENTGKSQVLLGLLGRQILQDRGWLK